MNVRTHHIGARVTEDQAEQFSDAADQLGVSLSDLVVGCLDVLSGEVKGSGWETRMLHLVQDRVVSIGEDAPTIGGIPVPSCAYPVVAPQVFWDHLERELARNQKR